MGKFQKLINHYRACEERYKNLTDREHELWYKMMPGGIDYSSDRIISSNHSSIQDQMCYYIDAANASRSAYVRMCDAGREISACLNEMTPTARRILVMYYIDRKDMEAIAAKIDKSMKDAETMRRSAIRTIDAIITARNREQTQDK